MSKSIVITGASSGIGAALAHRYAREKACLGLVGLNEERLEIVAAEARGLGATEVRFAAIDVRNRQELMEWIEAFDRAHPIDMIIANAGVTGGTPPGEDIEPADESYALFQTNVLGVMNSVHPVLPGMMSRKDGQIAILGSLAGFLPLPHAPSYSASKAAVMTYGLALRELLMDYGIRVNVICPGFVKTAMTARITGRKEYEISAEDAAERIFKGLARNPSILAFPRYFAFSTRIARLYPDWLLRRTSKPYRYNVSRAE